MAGLLLPKWPHSGARPPSRFHRDGRPRRPAAAGPRAAEQEQGTRVPRLSKHHHDLSRKGQDSRALPSGLGPEPRFSPRYRTFWRVSFRQDSGVLRYRHGPQLASSKRRSAAPTVPFPWRSGVPRGLGASTGGVGGRTAQERRRIGVSRETPLTRASRGRGNDLGPLRGARIPGCPFTRRVGSILRHRNGRGRCPGHPGLH